MFDMAELWFEFALIEPKCSTSVFVVVVHTNQQSNTKHSRQLRTQAKHDKTKQSTSVIALITVGLSEWFDD
jgi:hypothetical protein